MAKIQGGYFRDPAVQASMPRVAQSLRDSKSSLSRARFDAVKALHRRGIAPSRSEAYDMVDGAIFEAGDDPDQALVALRRLLPDRARGREVGGEIADIRMGEAVAETPGLEQSYSESERMAQLELPNETLFQAYADIFGVRP